MPEALISKVEFNKYHEPALWVSKMVLDQVQPQEVYLSKRRDMRNLQFKRSLFRTKLGIFEKLLTVIVTSVLTIAIDSLYVGKIYCFTNH